jgi:peptidoglycan/xylan/chitin deacetylase (PgdA/CDA1 family)
MISISRKSRAFLSKIKFAAGMDPLIEKSNDWRRFIPEPYSAVLLIQADFEMAWASRWSKRFSGNIQGVLEMARRERKNIPQILDLCDRFKIPVTWATVGHLLLDSCQRQNKKVHQDIPQLPEFENDYWKYSGQDWFEHDPGTDVGKDPEWYAPDLVKDILGRKTKHEIGCHTFSHIDCRDEICPAELMRAELQECKKLAKEYGIELKSFVHPGHTIGNLDTLAKEGFSNFRTDYRNVLGYPKKQDNGLWEFEQTAEIAYRKDWSIDYHIHRYITIIKRAIKLKTIGVFWFHPSFNLEVIETILSEVFQYIDENRDKIWIAASGEYVEWLYKSESNGKNIKH